MTKNILTFLASFILINVFFLISNFINSKNHYIFQYQHKTFDSTFDNLTPSIIVQNYQEYPFFQNKVIDIINEIEKILKGKNQTDSIKRYDAKIINEIQNSINFKSNNPFNFLIIDIDISNLSTSNSISLMLNAELDKQQLEIIKEILIDTIRSDYEKITSEISGHKTVLFNLIEVLREQVISDKKNTINFYSSNIPKVEQKLSELLEENLTSDEIAKIVLNLDNLYSNDPKITLSNLEKLIENTQIDFEKIMNEINNIDINFTDNYFENKLTNPIIIISNIIYSFFLSLLITVFFIYFIMRRDQNVR